MLMRYLFLDTAFSFMNRCGTLIPVLLELRRLNTQASKGISAESILELVHSCMREFDAQFDSEQVKSSLRKGKLLLLFDGFDEVSETLARETADAIHRFCSNYSKSPCVITSRPNAYTVPLQTFSTLESLPLRKDQAVELARILWDEDEKTREFCHQLDRELFKRHKDFAENPLLLTMMFLTFMRNLSIPEHLSEFYQKAYEALYSAHDNQNKGIFKREFNCRTLDEKTFANLFAYFCFQSYFKDEYEFTKEQILAYLDKGIKKLCLLNVSADAYLADLQNIVCMIIHDGNLFHFSHRSFQAYFAAIFTCDLSDVTQKQFFCKLFSKERWYRRRDYFTLFYQCSPEKFVTNALEDDLRLLQSEAEASLDANLFFLNHMYDGIRLDRTYPESKKIDFYVNSLSTDRLKSHNVIDLFSTLIQKNNPFVFFGSSDDYFEHAYVEYGHDLRETFYEYSWRRHNGGTWYAIRHGSSITFHELEITQQKDTEYKNLYQAIIQATRIDSTRTAIRQWLAKQDEKRRAQQVSSSFSDFLDSL